MRIETEEVEGNLRGPRQLEQAWTVVPTKGHKLISFIKRLETLALSLLVLNSPRFSSPSLSLLFTSTYAVSFIFWLSPLFFICSSRVIIFRPYKSFSLQSPQLIYIRSVLPLSYLTLCEKIIMVDIVDITVANQSFGCEEETRMATIQHLQLLQYNL